MDSSAPKKFPVVPVVVAVAVVAVAVAVFSGAGLKSEKPRENQSSGKATQTQTGGWARRTVKEVSLESPVDFVSSEEIMSKMPKMLGNMTEYFEVYQGEDGDKSVTTVSRISYKTGITPTLDGAAQGAMNGAAGMMGDPKPKFSVNTTTVGGLHARRASYRNTVSGKNLQIEALFVSSGRKLWQVQVIFEDPSQAADASRILKSVAITP